MIIKLVYSDTVGQDLLQYLKDSDYELIALNEDYYKDKKKAVQVKASCGTKMIPFVAIYNDDKELIKAFYTEVNECTCKNIKNYLEND